VLEFDDRIANAGSASQRIYPYVRLSRVAPPPPPKHSFMTNPETFSFVGAAWYTPEDKYGRPSCRISSTRSRRPVKSGVGWIAMLAAPLRQAPGCRCRRDAGTVDTNVEQLHGNPLYFVRSTGAALDVAPARPPNTEPLWVGPKLQKPMAELARRCR
jgi:YidC/Oxa1 family membrane protein insertase